jgi:hypothetical protein
VPDAAATGIAPFDLPRPNPVLPIGEEEIPMREAGEAMARDDATVEEACPACAGRVVVRPRAGSAWVYCESCRRLSRSVLVPGPGGGSVLVHPLAAA